MSYDIIKSFLNELDIKMNFYYKYLLFYITVIINSDETST